MIAPDFSARGAVSHSLTWVLRFAAAAAAAAADPDAGAAAAAAAAAQFYHAEGYESDKKGTTTFFVVRSLCSVLT